MSELSVFPALFLFFFFMYLAVFNYISTMLFDAITDCPFRDSKILRYSFYCRYLTEIANPQQPLEELFCDPLSALCALLIVYAAFLPCRPFILRLDIFQGFLILLPCEQG